MAEFPALPLWTDAYLGDTWHLKDGERGRYDLMLIQLWRMPEARFPNDDAWLARKFNRPVEDIETLFRPLVREFFQCDGNWITQKRLTRERAFVRAQSQKQSVRAKARWNKENGVSRGNATCGIPSGNAPTPTPTPTPTEKEKMGKKKVGKERGSRWPEGAVIPGDWIEIAASKRHEMKLHEIDLRLEAEKFVNYWSSRSDRGAAKVDWKRTWINWILDSKQVANGRNGRSAHDKFLAAAESLIRDQLNGGSPEESADHPDALPLGGPLLPS